MTENTPDDTVAQPGGGSVSTDSVDAALDSLSSAGLSGYNYAYLDEHTKREVRRATLKAVALPGHQVPYASRPMPLARGWGTGGIQASLSILGPADAFKVTAQGADESVNAANNRRRAEKRERRLDATGSPATSQRHRP